MGGATSTAAYLGFGLIVPRSAQYATVPSTMLFDALPVWMVAVGVPAPRLQSAGAAMAAVTLASVAMMVCYLLAVLATNKSPTRPIHVGIVIGFAVVFGMIGILSLPTLSS